MNIDHLRSFHRVAMAGSFTKAARELFLTQPAVSMHVQALEADLGVALFDRTRRQIRLTGEGETLFAYTSKLFGLFDELREVFHGLSGLQAGRLALGATMAMGAYNLTGRIARFNKRYPRIEFDLQIANSRRVAEMVDSGEVELGFAPQSEGGAHLTQLFLHREKMVVVTAPDSPLAGKGLLTAQDLIAVPFVMREKGTRMRTRFSGWFSEKTGLPGPGHVVTLSNLEATKRLVASGYGAAALPAITVEQELAAGTLAALTVAGLDLCIDYYLLFNPGRRLSKAATAFLSLLRQDGLPVPPELLGGDDHAPSTGP